MLLNTWEGTIVLYLAVAVGRFPPSPPQERPPVRLRVGDQSRFLDCRAIREARQALELQRGVVESVQGHVDDMYAHLQTLVFTVEGQAEQSSRAKRNLKQLEERERNGVQKLEKMVQHKVERLLKLFPIHRTTSQTRGAFNCIAGLSLPLDGNLVPGHRAGTGEHLLSHQEIKRKEN